MLLPMMHALLKPNSFVAPEYSGNVGAYPQFAHPVQIKSANVISVQAQNKWKSYKNIQCACFRMLDKNVASQLKCQTLNVT
jgi:hypothetical protein